MTDSFKAQLKIIGINPYVFVPEEILVQLFRQAGKDKGHIPVSVFIENKKHTQTLVKYSGDWRLYINTKMLKNSPKRIGEMLDISIEYDPVERKIKPHPQFLEALNQHPDAKKVFENLSPSKQHEIVRYISSLKTTESVERNIIRAIGFLKGNNNFVGREKP